ncbi:MAG: ATPase [Bacteroidales bacterium]|nr:ATPase [Bacteroidales bacterium]
MILVADSGSTKTDWMWGTSPEKYMATSGLNPHFVNDKQLQTSLNKVRHQCGPIDTIFFYGAGCGATSARQRIITALHQHFPSSYICVEGDLMGACRATCGNHSGIVGILGTGSNACFYDGYRIVKSLPSAGYILGDEGSGCHIGRLLVKDYIRQLMPDPLCTYFQKYIQMEYDELMTTIYERPAANRFFASLVPFALQNRETTYIQDLLLYAFGEFLSRQVQQIGQGCELYLTGSIAATFEKEVRISGEKRGYQIKNIIPRPIQALISYHNTHLPERQ